MNHPGLIFVPLVAIASSLILSGCAPGRNDVSTEIILTDEQKKQKEAEEEIERRQGKRITLTERRDQEEIKAPFLMEAPETGVNLGWGWNTFRAEPIPTICIEFQPGNSEAQTTTLSFKEVSDSFELMRAMDISAAASVKTVGYKVKGSAQFAKDAKVSSLSTTYMIQAEVQNDARYAGPASPQGSDVPVETGGGAVRLTPAAAVLAREDVKTFKETCGNGYVSATMGGAKLIAVVQIETKSTQEKETLKTAVSGSGGWGAKVAIAVKAEDAKDKTTDSFRREISFYQTGGKNQDLPTDADAIKDRVTELAAQAGIAEKLFQIAVTPYEILENWPRSETIIGEETEFEELVALWGAYKTLYGDIQRVLDEPIGYIVPTGRICKPDGLCDVTAALIDFEQRTNSDRIITLEVDTGKAQIEGIRHIEDIQDEVLATLDRLELKAEECVVNEETCIFESGDYRSPYAIRAQLPIPGCFLYPNTPMFSQPSDEDLQPLFELLKCEPARAVVSDSFDEGALKRYVDIQIGNPAKSRCKLGSLTPGCLSNEEIRKWGNRVGMRSIVDRGDVLERALGALQESQVNEVDFLWGDPGSDTKTTIWIEAIQAESFQCTVDRARDETLDELGPCNLLGLTKTSLQEDASSPNEPAITLADWRLPAGDEANVARSDLQAENNGLHYVQLAALSGEAAARDYLDRIPSAIAAKAHGLETRFERSGERQSGREQYLVQVGAFSSDDVARTWCADLLSIGMDCFVVQP